MNHLRVVGSSIAAAAFVATLAVSRGRRVEEQAEYAALKAAHAALKRRAAALEATVNRLERGALSFEREKDEFLAVLSHELRSPLNAILGWIELLRLHLTNPAQQAHAINIIERNAHAQMRVIADLLDMARLVTRRLSLNRERFALQVVVQEATNAVREAATTKGIALHIDSPNDVHVVGDRSRLRQVVAQLLANAVKFTQPGGRVLVTVGRDASDAIVQVADTGIGITREMLPQVFERFRQAESGLTRTYGGLGLGLAIVRHLVELHGGTVEADSRGLRQGATFTVRLPHGAGA